MALSMQLLIAFPSTAKTRFAIPRWDVRERIDLGDIVRLESLVAAGADGKFDAHERASICMARMVLDRLMKRAEGLERDCFAPHFLLYDLLRDDAAERAVALAVEAKEKGCVDCGPRDASLSHILAASPGGCYPSRGAMERHNELMAMNDGEMRRFLKQERYAVFGAAPLMWAKCGEIADWMDLDFKSAEPAACEACRMPISEARVAAWGEYLRRLGECDARAIAVFPSLDAGA